MMKPRKVIWHSFILTGLVLWGASPAHSIPAYNPSDLSALTNDLAAELITVVGMGAAHRSYEAASPLGAMIGLDIGVDVTAISLTDDFVTALNQAGVNQDIPAYLPLPRLNIHKGLPGNVDLGFSLITYDGSRVIGGNVKWAFLTGEKGPIAVAVRAGYTSTELFFLKTNTTQFDVIASKRLGWFFEPYLGTGYQRVSGSIETELNGPQGLSHGVSASHAVSALHFYAGLPIRLGVIKLTPEYDYSLAGLSTAGLKFSLSL